MPAKTGREGNFLAAFYREEHSLSDSTSSSKGGRRRLSRRALIALVGLGAALIVAVPTAWAIHDFTDVPDAHPFHADISAVKGAGITAGKTCVPPGTPPTYCPSEPITREAMAAFMRRGAGRMAQDVTADVAANLTGTAYLTVEEEDMIVGGVNGIQLVQVNAWATIDAATGGLCPCEFEATIWQDIGLGSQVISQPTYVEVEGGDGDIDATAHVSYAFRTTSGLHDYTLRLRNWNTVGTFNITGATIIVTTAPFDQGGGTGTLDGQGATPKTPENQGG